MLQQYSTHLPKLWAPLTSMRCICSNTRNTFKDRMTEYLANPQNFGVPPKASIMLPSEMFTNNHPDWHSIHVKPDDEENKDILRRNVTNFYKVGNFPRALGLHDPKPGGLAHDQRAKEIESYVQSGSSLLVKDTKTNEPIGFIVGIAWQVNPKYRPIECHAQDWFQMATDLVSDMNTDIEEAKITWRKLQQFSCYNLYQKEAQKRGLDYIFYLYIIYIEPTFRNKKLGVDLVTSLLTHIPDNVGLCVSSTFKDGRQVMARLFPQVKQVDYLPYNTLKWKLDGEYVFQSIWDQDGFSYLMYNK